MKNMTLKQFRYFEAVARFGHFGRAADASAISQPALSMQIKELEDVLGSPLFERAARQVRLTGFGEEFAVRVREVLRSVDEISDLAQSMQDGVISKFRLGVIPTIAPYLLPRIIGTLNDAHAGIDLHIRETQTDTLIEELKEGLIDAALLALPISEPSLAEKALFDEDFVLIRPECDADLPVPNSETLKKMRLLLLEEGHCFRDQALSFCNVTSKELRAGMDGSSLSTLVQMVSAGIGVTLIPEMAVPVETRATPVHVCRFTAPKPSRTIGMVWRKSNPLFEQIEDVARLVGEAVEA
ncbi:MAG: LysR substrate-binding domain-containing protein [Hyphomicrobiales bacterium]